MRRRGARCTQPLNLRCWCSSCSPPDPNNEALSSLLTVSLAVPARRAGAAGSSNLLHPRLDVLLEVRLPLLLEGRLQRAGTLIQATHAVCLPTSDETLDLHERRHHRAAPRLSCPPPGLRVLWRAGRPSRTRLRRWPKRRPLSPAYPTALTAVDVLSQNGYGPDKWADLPSSGGVAHWQARASSQMRAQLVLKQRE